MEEIVYVKMMERAKQIYKDEPSGHDYNHIRRVLKYCKDIAKDEGGDLDVVYTSAIFHDIHRVLQSETGKVVSAVDAMPKVIEVISEFKNDLSEEQIKQILFNIEHHDDKDMKTEQMPVELTILQDADMIDSLGKIGLQRTEKYCRKHKVPKYSAVSLDSADYIPNVFPISTTHYVYRTMLPLYDKLRTKTAKEKVSLESKQVLLDFIKNNQKEYKNSVEEVFWE